MWVGSGDGHCALPRMRSHALCPTTILSQVMSPTSSTTTTSQRPLKSSSRSLPATASPQLCMTWSSITTPSLERSHHQCSLRSEKIQRAVDKLIALLTKACCQVSRCLSVMSEQGDLFPMSLDHLIIYVREKPRRDSENEQIRILLERRKRRFSLNIELRFRNTFQADYDRTIQTLKLSSLNEGKFIVLFKETNNIHEINILFMNNYWNKNGIFVKLTREVSMRWKN